MEINFKIAIREFLNYVFAGLLGGYTAIFLNALKEANSSWNSIDSSLLMMVSILILGFLFFMLNNKNRYKKRGKTHNV